MRILTMKELQFLRRLYANSGQKYVPTIGLLDNFIYRFEKHPEWMGKVQFLTKKESTLNEGTFVMVYATVDGPLISVDSLECTPYRNLEHLLNTLNYSKEKIYIFWTIREEFHILIENLVKANNLETLKNSNAECRIIKMDRCKVLKMIQNAPEGFYYDSLKESDVPKITSILPYTVPSGYLEAIIKYNPTTAFYTHDGELIAWVALHENGELGLLKVVKEYKRRGLGRQLVLRQLLKFQDMGRLIFRKIYDGNNVAHDFSGKVNDEIGYGISAGKFRYITAIPRVNENSKKSKL